MPTVIPTMVQFQSDTNLKTALSGKRAGDVILHRIDTLLDAYHQAATDQAKVVLLGKLYYAANAWLKEADRGGPGINPRRKDAVYAFFVKVVTRLSEDTTVAVNLLPNWLTETFGRSMHQHGIEIDLTGGCAEYLSAKEVAKFRLEFRGGLAYQRQWWRNSTDLVVADSADVRKGEVELRAKQGTGGDQITAGYSGYVMSMGGDLYTGPHFTAANFSKGGRYHSSYLAGEAVLSAGEIKVEGGHVRQINNNSGHYRPGPEKLMMAVEVLATLGVPMAELKVEAIGHGVVSGVEFLKAWETTVVGAGKVGAWGDTPLARYQVGATLRAHNRADEVQKAFTLFKTHWLPKARGGHAPHGKDKCQACKDFRIHWPTFDWAITEYGGVDRIPNRTIQPAVLPAPPGP